MAYLEGSRDRNKALGMWLWSIEKEAETETMHWECGYGVLRRE